MDRVNSLKSVLIVATTWTVAMMVIYVTSAIVMGQPINFGSFVPAIATIGICRWVWRGSAISRYVAIAWSVLSFLGFAAMSYFMADEQIAVLAMTAISALVWGWISVALLTSAPLKQTMATHWALVSSQQNTPSYIPTLTSGAIAGAVMGICVVGGILAQKYYTSNIVTQNYLERLANDTNASTPMNITEWLVLNRVESGPNSLTFYYEFTDVEDGITIDDLKAFVLETPDKSDCSKGIVKKMLDSNVQITRNYIYKAINGAFDISLNEFCKSTPD